MKEVTNTLPRTSVLIYLSETKTKDVSGEDSEIKTIRVWCCVFVSMQKSLYRIFHWNEYEYLYSWDKSIFVLDYWYLIHTILRDRTNAPFTTRSRLWEWINFWLLRQLNFFEKVRERRSSSCWFRCGRTVLWASGELWMISWLLRFIISIIYINCCIV